ncbi:MAG: HEPN domain-containing protein [Colwellia sp.]|jgi:hypothetical protein
MEDGKLRILEVIDGFTGTDGEPRGDGERYVLKSMWLMMMSEFEAVIKTKVENYIDVVKQRDINDIHVCLLTRNFFGDKKEALTLNRIISFYKKNPTQISYANFTRDRVPKYKSEAVIKLFNNLGIFFDEEESISISFLDGIAQTRDAIAHGDTNVAITRSELQNNITILSDIMITLQGKLDAH